MLLELITNGPVKNIKNYKPGKGSKSLKKAVKECVKNKDRKALRNFMIGFLFN